MFPRIFLLFLALSGSVEAVSDPCARTLVRPSSKMVGPFGRITPFMAVNGPLAFTPEKPPTDPWVFDYFEVFPELFEQSERRESRNFGSKTSGWPVRDFWADPDPKERIYFSYGGVSKDQTDFKAPIAVYGFARGPHPDSYLLIQGPNQQVVNGEDQPFLREGRVRLYRGIRTSAIYQLPHYVRESEFERETHLHYQRILAQSFSEAELVFELAHALTFRSETHHIRPRHEFFFAGYPESTPARKAALLRLEKAFREHFSTKPAIAARKFGPNYVAFETPLTNTRIASFFSGENEATVLDFSKLKLVKSVGCEVKPIAKHAEPPPGL